MKKPLIYIVDDDTVFAKVLQHKFEMLELNAIVFKTGEQCIVEINQNPDYVFLDFSLNGLNGLDVLKVVKNKSKGTKVYIITVIDDPKLSKTCIEAGAENYFVKNEEGMAEVNEIINHISRSSKGLFQRIFS